MVAWHAGALAATFDKRPSGTFTEVSVGDDFACGLRTSGRLACWGSSTLYSIMWPLSGKFKQVSAGDGFACGLREGGDAACWGANSYGAATPPSGIFSQVSSGSFFTCGLTTDGTSTCWGHTPMLPSGTFTRVSDSGLSTVACGLRSDGTVACWNGAYRGPFGFAIQGAPPGRFTEISVYDSSFCGLRMDGRLACWGLDGTTPSGKFTRVSVGASFACGVRSSGRLACWGPDYEGDTKPPTGKFTQVSAGQLFACGVRSGGRLACWGSNTQGDTKPLSGKFTQVSAGYDFACGVSRRNHLVCWGNNYNGQLVPPLPAASPRCALGRVSLRTENIRQLGLLGHIQQYLPTLLHSSIGRLHMDKRGRIRGLWCETRRRRGMLGIDDYVFAGIISVPYRHFLLCSNRLVEFTSNERLKTESGTENCRLSPCARRLGRFGPRSSRV